MYNGNHLNLLTGEITEKQGKKPAEDREEIRRKYTKHEKHIPKKHSSHGNESLGSTYDEWSSVKGGRISKDTTQIIESNHGNNSRLPDGKESKLTMYYELEILITYSNCLYLTTDETMNDANLQ